MAQLLTIPESILAIVPALAANGAPVLLKYHGTPIDGGRRFLDGRPVLGPGKTWEGLATGVLYGSVIALLAACATCNPKLYAAGVFASIGAMLGDMLGAFIKRRLGLERGAPAPLLDQLDFYSGALLALYAAGYIVHPLVALAFAPIVVVLHRLTNMAANKLKLKPVPW